MFNLKKWVLNLKPIKSWQRKQKKALGPLDLTHTQFVLLASLSWLSRENNAVTQVDIANQSNADRMMVSKVLRTLEEKKFITRQEHETDTRAKTIQLTKLGTETLQKAIVKVENGVKNFIDRSRLSPQEKSETKPKNRKVSKILQSYIISTFCLALSQK